MQGIVKNDKIVVEIRISAKDSRLVSYDQAWRSFFIDFVSVCVLILCVSSREIFSLVLENKHPLQFMSSMYFYRAASPIDFDSGIDFTNAFDPRHDVTFIIGEERIYAGKQVLLIIHDRAFEMLSK